MKDLESAEKEDSTQRQQDKERLRFAGVKFKQNPLYREGISGQIHFASGQGLALMGNCGALGADNTWVIGRMENKEPVYATPMENGITTEQILALILSVKAVEEFNGEDNE